MQHADLDGLGLREDVRGTEACGEKGRAQSERLEERTTFHGFPSRVDLSCCDDGRAAANGVRLESHLATSVPERAGGASRLIWRKKENAARRESRGESASMLHKGAKKIDAPCFGAEER